MDRSIGTATNRFIANSHDLLYIGFHPTKSTIPFHFLVYIG